MQTAVVVLLVGGMVPPMLTYDYCYKNCGPNKHVLCGVTKCLETFCEGNEPDFYWRKDVLDNHNFHRWQYASGVGGHPSATNMMALSYNLELETCAACVLYSRGFDISGCLSMRNFYLVGMNTMSSTTIDPCTKNSIKNAIEVWTQENSNMNMRIIEKYPTRRRQRTNYSRFTQMIWAETTDVGCARCRKNETFMMMCLYGPSGNIPHHPVYERGPPASQCPQEVAPNQKHPQLCGEDVLPVNASVPGLQMDFIAVTDNAPQPALPSAVVSIWATFIWLRVWMWALP